MAKKSTKKGSSKKKSTPKKTKAQKKEKTALNTEQTTLETAEDKKGKLVVSQRERDEIDAVVDTVWSFAYALRNAWDNSRSILIAGIIIGLLGVSFSGWGQEVVGLEQSGIWYAITENPNDLVVNSYGRFFQYSPGDDIRIEGKLTEIRYFGDIENGLYPIPPNGLDPAVAPGDSYKLLNDGTKEMLFSSSSGNNSEMNINFASSFPCF